MEINNKGLYIFKDNDFKPYEIPQGKVILCGVPGAFTSGCTNKHLPGYANNLEKLGCKVVFVGVNDPSVMHEWNVLHGHEDIDAIADPLAVFSKSIGKDKNFGDTMGNGTNPSTHWVSFVAPNLETLYAGMDAIQGSAAMAAYSKNANQFRNYSANYVTRTLLRMGGEYR